MKSSSPNAADQSQAATTRDSDSIRMPRGAPDDGDRTPDTLPDRVGNWLDSGIRAFGRRLLRTFPQFESQLTLTRSLYADFVVRANAWRYNRRHTAPIDPYRVLWVDPARIDRLAEPESRSRFQRFATVATGDWDRYEVRFTDTDVYRGFERHFVDGVPWTETAFFRRVIEEISAGKERWGCTSRSAFRARCDRLDSLYDAIQEHGILSQRQLYEAEIEDPIGHRRTTLSDRLINDEIAIEIGRDGELLFADGRNRLAIAKLLDVDAVPVVVFRRHEQWVATRDAAASLLHRGGELRGPLREHPDLAALRTDSER